MMEHLPRQNGLRTFRADLHIHTALSPCASDAMTPPAIVAAAMEAGLDMIAVSDHNSGRNIRAVQQAAAMAGGTLTVLPGMEITSAEEAHVLGLFPDVAAAERVGAMLRTLLRPADAHYFAFFGGQPVLAADGRKVDSETAALAAATPLDLNAAVQLIHEAGGLAIAAHVDRRAFGVFSQLGFFPEDAHLDAVEMSRHAKPDSPLFAQFAALGLAVTGASDSHFLEEVGTAYTELLLASPDFPEIRLALAGREGRSAVRA